MVVLDAFVFRNYITQRGLPPSCHPYPPPELYKPLECNLLVVTSLHLILCQEQKLQLYNFQGKKERECVEPDLLAVVGRRWPLLDMLLPHIGSKGSKGSKGFHLESSVTRYHLPLAYSFSHRGHLQGASIGPKTRTDFVHCGLVRLV